MAIKQDVIRAWLYALVGLYLLYVGLRLVADGAIRLFRFYVGRSSPSSLSKKKNKAGSSGGDYNQGPFAYSPEQLESMLNGRKNLTFKEPSAWLEQLLHTIYPSLLFAPYRMRNLAQELFSTVVTTMAALVAYSISYFVCSNGLAGKAGTIIIPIMSVGLLVYLTFVWLRAANLTKTFSDHQLSVKSAFGLSRLIGFSILVPVLLGYGYNQLPQDIAKEVLSVAQMISFNAWFNLLLLFGLVLLVLSSQGFLLHQRLKVVNATTEVSEYRENLQESVHPRELFIHLENSILANLRYKEMPNRVYQDLEPSLDEQGKGKGNFHGQLLLETQPVHEAIGFSDVFKIVRFGSSFIAQILTVLGVGLTVWAVFDGYDGYQLITHEVQHLQGMRVNEADLYALIEKIANFAVSFLTLLFAMTAVKSAAKILKHSTHHFWAEIQFNSLLIWMKMDGTFNESKISTGMSIHDSTRSENVLVRSSISPWFICSRITSSVFVRSGKQNLEVPRLIMSMMKTDSEMKLITAELKKFLQNRESIAAIRNEQDLGHTNTIFQVNEATRAHINLPQDTALMGIVGAQRHIEESTTNDNEFETALSLEPTNSN
ncbi:conserved hypothetical protein [Shewanella sp. ANA-3]|nr:conserved hypothetical protein [Shewanella sp. ANA-3]